MPDNPERQPSDEVVVADAGDRRFVPYCDVQARLDGDGTDRGPVGLPFLWHPGLYHYGANVAVPERGQYDLHVTVEPPTFARHDRQNGDRYDDVAEVTLEGVTLPPGETEAGPRRRPPGERRVGRAVSRAPGRPSRRPGGPGRSDAPAVDGRPGGATVGVRR